mgnify:CR=1 FL=1
MQVLTAIWCKFLDLTHKFRQPVVPQQLANCLDLSGVVPVVLDQALHGCSQVLSHHLAMTQ